MIVMARRCVPGPFHGQCGKMSSCVAWSCVPRDAAESGERSRPLSAKGYASPATCRDDRPSEAFQAVAC
jgi:hypothetical protein